MHAIQLDQSKARSGYDLYNPDTILHQQVTQKVQLLFHKEREKEGDKNPIIKAKVGLKNKEQQSLAVVVVGGVVFFVSQNYCC